MSTEVSAEVTRRSASNLALAFVLLPRDRRDSMAALYAFCREVDDVADEDTIPVEERRTALARWREEVRIACEGGQPTFPVIRELQPVIRRHGLLFEHFDGLIRGCEQDLTRVRYRTLAELEHYCYLVASVVGLLSIEVFGYRDPACREYAVALGKALQFTNILRDVGGDARRGRIYLPQEMLARHAVSEADILHGRRGPGFDALAREFAGLARDHYRQAAALLPPAERRNMVAAELMGSVYWDLLLKLEHRGFPVLNPAPFRLSRSRKLTLILLAWIRIRTGLRMACYGR